MTGQRKCAWILFVGVQMFLAAQASAQAVPLPDLPQARANNHVVSLTLNAVNENGRDAIAFEGVTVAPVIRPSPGDTGWRIHDGQLLA